MSLAKDLNIISYIFWLVVGVAMLTSGLLFRDLADVSQWIIQTDRADIMWTWYNRNGIALVSVVALISLFIIWFKQKDLLAMKWLMGLVGTIVFLFYSGFINPHLMMRERQDDGVFVTVEAAKKYMTENESVIVIDVNGKARAHADKQLLRPHVASNGKIGGEDVVMTYCGLTNLGMAVIPELDGQRLDLRPMNQLENNLVLADRITGEPIQQLWMTKESDKLAGVDNKLQEWPSFRMPFAKFAQAYPDGEVFLNDYDIEELKPSFFENPFLAIYDPIMDLVFDHAIDAQANDPEPVFPTIENIDERLANKEKIWGFNVGNDYVAYTEDFVRQSGDLINVEVGGQKVVVYYSDEFESLGIYYNATANDIESMNFFGDTEYGKLPRVETVKAGAYWIVWANFFPQTDVNRR